MTAGASPQQGAIAPGWYWAEGDPPNSARYWGGDEWLTGPTEVEELMVDQPAPTGSTGLVTASILWNILLFVAWVLVIATLALHGVVGIGIGALGGDSELVRAPSWFVFSWLYLAAAPIAGYAIVWGRNHQSGNVLLASFVVPAVPVAIALLAFAQS